MAQEAKRLRDSEENPNRTDDRELDDTIADLKNRIEVADRLESCLQCKKCNAILDVLRNIAIDARNDLVQVNPQNVNEVLRLQQTAKLFDAVELVIRNTINQGQLALDQISPQED